MFTTIQKEENTLQLFVFKKYITRRVRRRFHEANIVGVPCKRAQHCCATLRRHRTVEILELVGPKVLPVSNCTQQMPTSANIVVVPCKRTQQVTTLLGPWPTMLGPFAWAFTPTLSAIYSLLNHIRSRLAFIRTSPKTPFRSDRASFFLSFCTI